MRPELGSIAAAGGGSWPVAKSYPQSSQNSASDELAALQFGHRLGALPVGNDSDEGLAGGVAGGAVDEGAAGPVGASGGFDVPVDADTPGSIGAPHTSQKSSVDELCPCGQTALICKPSWRIAQQPAAWRRGMLHDRGSVRS
jgi:hypothetical protein